MEITTDGVYLITGGGGAIAGAVASVFADAGARLVLADVDVERVRAAAARTNAHPVVADLRSLAGAEGMVSAAMERFGRVDGLVHTAGGFAMAPADKADEAHFDRLFESNVRTLFCSVRAVLPGLLRQGSGFVAGFSSSAAWGGGAPGMAVYAAAKGAVALYLRSLEQELRGTGVRVAVVYPMSSVDTEANRRSSPQEDFEGWVDPVEIGHALLFAATRGRRGKLLELPIASTR